MEFYLFLELTYQQEVTLSGNKVTAEICDALVKKVSIYKSAQVQHPL